ncbi:MAG: glycosyltransferase family 1 protein [Anaerolineaceae bacterium]|nr:MAG: glycosyltransferase family 1 protein [Anaerolineaceae bacterium]
MWLACGRARRLSAAKSTALSPRCIAPARCKRLLNDGCNTAILHGMTHIGIDARLTAYRPGGISTYTRRLIEALSQTDHDNRYTILQSRKATSAITARLPERHLWTPPHHRWERVALSIEISRFKLDVFHSTDFIPARWGARRQVITVHDLAFLLLPEHKDRAASRYYNDQIAWAVARADHILSVSEATRDDLMRLLDVPAHKITVQPHGVEPRFFDAAEDVAVDGLPPVYLLYVGTLEPRKNIDTLLSAYQRLTAPPPLVLAGRIGWLFDATLHRIKALQADGHAIIHRDDITDAQLPALYRGAAALLLPSHYEGFGLTALEGMACGVPVIAGDTSSLPEVVGDGGLLLPPDDVSDWVDGIRQALDDSGWRAAVIERGLRRARQFTWANSAQIARSVYENIS